MAEYKLNIVADTTNFHNEIEKCKNELIEMENMARRLNHVSFRFGKRNWIQRVAARLFRL